MIRKVIDYVREDQFEIRIQEDAICILNYTDISFMEEEKILLHYSDGSVFIRGKQLVVVKLLEQEMLIKGKFDTIEFRRNHE